MVLKDLKELVMMAFKGLKELLGMERKEIRAKKEPMGLRDRKECRGFKEIKVIKDWTVDKDHKE
jgi:hypothetical protein